LATGRQFIHQVKQINKQAETIYLINRAKWPTTAAKTRKCLPKGVVRSATSKILEGKEVRKSNCGGSANTSFQK
jgi:hypothetical protein